MRHTFHLRELLFFTFFVGWHVFGLITSAIENSPDGIIINLVGLAWNTAFAAHNLVWLRKVLA